MMIDEIKKIAIQNLKKDKYVTPVIIFEGGKILPADFSSEKEKTIFLETLKEIVEKNNVKRYWHVTEAWSSSNPHVNRPKNDLYREEIIMISEYTNDGSKGIIIPFERKDDKIKVKKEKHLDSGKSVSRFNVLRDKDIDKFDMRTEDLINRIKEANMSDFCKRFKEKYLEEETDKEKIERVKNLTEEKIKEELIKSIKELAEKGKIIDIPNGVLPRDLMRDDEKMKKDMIDMKDKETNKCPDCNVKPGEYHMVGCDVERCPTCGGQLISCSHKPLHKDRMKWTGKWPFSEFCEKEAIDLNTLYSEYKWIKENQTWEKK